MRIGIFGGSFNPVHNGHLALARAALKKLHLTKVIFVPSHQTPLKRKQELLPGPLRMSLLKAALEGAKHFTISAYEQRKKGPSYTVETLKYFRKKFGAKAEIYFIAGADILKKISRWKSLGQISKLCVFAIADRDEAICTKKYVAWTRIPFQKIPISSSQIRRRMKKGESVEGLVPKRTLPILKKYYYYPDKKY